MHRTVRRVRRRSELRILTGFTYPSGGAILGGDYVNGSVPKGIANKDITWQTIKMFDIGLDFSAWNGKLGLTFDYFRRHRDGLYARRNLSLPGSVGASLPLENLNSDRDTGFELELSHRNRVGDFSYASRAMFRSRAARRSTTSVPSRATPT
ncbi:MAG: TonB-dependent receptor domain-containing protein [Alistipes finegoldii]